MTAEGIAYIKSLHIIFVVTWFAGLFYMVRLFVYFCEAQDKVEPEKSILSEQYKIMMKRLWYIIAWPSMVLTVYFWKRSFNSSARLVYGAMDACKLVFITFNCIPSCVWINFKKFRMILSPLLQQKCDYGMKLLLYSYSPLFSL